MSCCHLAKSPSSAPSLSSSAPLLLSTERPSFEQIYMEFAMQLAKRSTCSRLQVGAVVVSADYTHVLGIGYNGNAKGLTNGCDQSTPGDCGCLHAEDNALLKTNAGPDIPKIIFVTHSPCRYCAKRIINKGGVTQVIYEQKYRSSIGLEILEQAKITTVHHPLSA